MRDEKEERKKQARSNKQTRQSNMYMVSLSLYMVYMTGLSLYTRQVSHFSTTILSAMLAGMDDREDPEDLITMEAMSGLSRIFSQIDEGHVRPILINIALRIRPCFEKVGGAALAAHLHSSVWAL